MALDRHDQRHRALARGVRAQDQDADRAALRRNCRHAVFGAARLRSDHERKVDGWESLAEKPSDQLFDLAA